MNDYAETPGILIASAKCESYPAGTPASGQELCAHYGLPHYPYLVYGTSESVQEYPYQTLNWVYSDMSEFAKEHLGPPTPSPPSDFAHFVDAYREGDNILCDGSMPLEQLEAKCAANSDCLGFSIGQNGVGGCLKACTTEINWVKGTGIDGYVKTGGCGASFVRTVNAYRESNNILCDWSMPLEQLETQCLASSDCLGVSVGQNGVGGCLKACTTEINWVRGTGNDGYLKTGGCSSVEASIGIVV